MVLSEGPNGAHSEEERVNDRQVGSLGLVNDKRQNDQLELAFEPIGKGEAGAEGLEGTESVTARDGNESLAEERLMEEVLNREPEEGIGASPRQQR